MKRATLWTGTIAIFAAAGAGCTTDPGVTVGSPGPGTGGGFTGGTAGAAGGRGAGGAGGSFAGPVWRDASAGNGGQGGGGPFADPDKKVCNFEKVGLDRQPPELLLVLDRSGTMGDAVGGATKWTAMAGALDVVVKATQGVVDWGLNLFPWPTATPCTTPARPLVEPAVNNHPPIATVLGMQMPGGGGAGSPGQIAIRNATAYFKARATPLRKYIAYASDGIPNCKGGMIGTGRDEPGTIAAIADAAAAGFQVFVIGIAADPADHAVLNQMAVAGKQPRSDPATRYYAVMNQAELVTALQAIAGIVASCTFTLKAPPPAPDDVAVDVGSSFIPRDRTSTDGWNYSSADNTSITLYGSYCDKLKAGAYTSIGFILGCPGVPPIK